MSRFLVVRVNLDGSRHPGEPCDLDEARRQAARALTLDPSSAVSIVPTRRTTAPEAFRVVRRGPARGFVRVYEPVESRHVADRIAYNAFHKHVGCSVAVEPIKQRSMTAEERKAVRSLMEDSGMSRAEARANVLVDGPGAAS